MSRAITFIIIYTRNKKFTMLITPIKFDKYMQLRHLWLCLLERDYGELEIVSLLPVHGELYNCQ